MKKLGTALVVMMSAAIVTAIMAGGSLQAAGAQTLAPADPVC